MKRNDVMQIFSALSNKALKANTLSTESLLEIHYMRLGMKKFLVEMGESETELLKSADLAQIPTKKENPTVFEAIAEIQKKEFQPKKLNFMEKEEFAKWVGELDMATVSDLAEFLLKQ